MAEIYNITTSSGQTIQFDAEDAEKISQFVWCAHKNKTTYYAHATERKNGKQRTICLHRIILDAPKGMEVDHIDGNGLNNCKSNLRLCTHANNVKNATKRSGTSSIFKGVYFHKANNKWACKIQRDNQRIFLGMFDDERSAAIAYNQAAKSLHGAFAKLNQVGGG